MSTLIVHLHHDGNVVNTEEWLTPINYSDTLSKGCCGWDDRNEIGPEAKGPYSQLQRQSVYGSITVKPRNCWHPDIKTCLDHIRSQRWFDTNAIAFMDLSEFVFWYFQGKNEGGRGRNFRTFGTKTLLSQNWIESLLKHPSTRPILRKGPPRKPMI